MAQTRCRPTESAGHFPPESRAGRPFGAGCGNNADSREPIDNGACLRPQGGVQAAPHGLETATVVGAASLHYYLDSPDETAPVADRSKPRKRRDMRHVLSALVMNQPGVLARISGMLASRGFNIDSLAVGETENPEFSRMTFVVSGDDRVLDQVRKQLEKIVTIVKVLDYSGKEHVERDLMLIKVKTEHGQRTEIKELVEIFRGRIVDVSPGHVMIEISGQEKKIEAFIEAVRPFGILELVRTGRIALLRSSSMSADVSAGAPVEE